MTIPKRHHYVPQLILDGFTDQEGWLYWCRTDDREATIYKARPSNLFLQGYLYSTISAEGFKDSAMERELLLLESKTAPVINAMLNAARAGQCPSLSLEEKRIWYEFFLTQWRRTPETQRAVVSDTEAMSMLDATLTKVSAELPHRREEIEALSTPEAKKRTIRNVRVDMLRQLSSNVMALLERRGIAILRITKPNKSFIVGSRPVVKLSVAGRSDLRDFNVEMWLPIASDIAVGVGRSSSEVSLGYLANSLPIRQLNTSIASQSSVIAACSPALVCSIVNRR